MNGWVKLHTSTIEWRWFTDVPTAHLWEYILLKANWKDKDFLNETIKRGSFVTSVANMSAESGLSPKQIRLAISKLERTGEITVRRTNKYSVISVVKWDEYQGSSNDEGKQTDTQRECQEETQTSSERATTEEYKTIRRKNIPPFIPPTLDEVRAYCNSRNSSVNPETFYEYFSTGGWKDSKGNPVRNWKQKLITWENHRNTNSVSKEEDKTVPTYDDTNNVCLPDSDLADILKEMRRI